MIMHMDLVRHVLHALLERVFNLFEMKASVDVLRGMITRESHHVSITRWMKLSIGTPTSSIPTTHEIEFSWRLNDFTIARRFP